MLECWSVDIEATSPRDNTGQATASPTASLRRFADIGNAQCESFALLQSFRSELPGFGRRIFFFSLPQGRPQGDAGKEQTHKPAISQL